MFTNPSQEDINKAMAKLVELGWITQSIQREGHGAIQFTEVGSVSMATLGALLFRISPMAVGEFSALSGFAIQHAEKVARGEL